MDRIAVFPGSFDPITKGHEAIVRRALNMFDHVIVAIGENPNKKYMFDLSQRLAWIDATFKDEPRVSTGSYEGLTMDYCKQKNARFIVRGLRTGIDFDYEKAIGQMNRAVGDIDSVFLITDPELSAINSSILRELIKNGQNVQEFIPDAITIK